MIRFISDTFLALRILSQLRLTGKSLDAYLGKNEINWLQLSEFKSKKESAVGEAFHVKWIPSMYLVDPDGKVVLGTVMIDKLRTALEKL